MSVLLDKLIFLLICVSFYLNTASGQYRAVPVIFAIIVSAAGSLLVKSKWRIGLDCLFILLAVVFPQLLFFLPLICLDIFIAQGTLYAFLVALPVFYQYGELETIVPFQLVLLVLLAWMFARRTEHLASWRQQALRTRDEAYETSMDYKRKQHDLIEKQDNEINMARLKERNRIAHEIHDNLGHQLSRAILQLGALKTICKEEQAASQIESVTSTLTEGMDSIRKSIHELYGHSLQFEQEIDRLTAGFEYCPLFLDYDVNGQPPHEIKNAVVAIIKEALTNVIKHSQATQVKITLHEHPAFYQLIIADNGKGFGDISRPEFKGMGLTGMRERVEKLSGSINITDSSGMRIFVRLPK